MMFQIIYILYDWTFYPPVLIFYLGNMCMHIMYEVCVAAATTPSLDVHSPHFLASIKNAIFVYALLYIGIWEKKLSIEFWENWVTWREKANKLELPLSYHHFFPLKKWK